MIGGLLSVGPARVGRAFQGRGRALASARGAALIAVADVYGMIMNLHTPRASRLGEGSPW